MYVYIKNTCYILHTIDVLHFNWLKRFLLKNVVQKREKRDVSKILVDSCDSFFPKKVMKKKERKYHEINQKL